MQKLKILTLSALAMMLVACQGGKTSDAPQADSTAAEAMTEAVEKVSRNPRHALD